MTSVALRNLVISVSEDKKNEKQSCSALSRRLNVSRTIIENIIKRFEESRTVADQMGRRCKPAFTAPETQEIFRFRKK